MLAIVCLASAVALLAGVQPTAANDGSTSSACPRFCDCFFANASVICSMHDGHFPADLPGDTQSLSLRPSSNKIRFLFLHNFFASSSPTYPYLRSFELRLETESSKASDRTKIRIHQGAFARSRFPMLETFALNGGAVLSLPATFLLDAPALVSLDLHDLLIGEVLPETFAPVGSSLENLNLSMNSIRQIDNNTFSGLTSLIRLDLSNNQISSIHPNAFVDLTRLAELYLRGNLLTSLGFYAADPSPPIFPQSLAVLDLSRNSRFVGFSSAFFGRSSRLNTLRLNNVPLNMSQQQLTVALAPLSKTLKTLELDGSISLRTLGPRLLRGFYLDRLSLNDNQLTSLDFISANDALVESLSIDANNLTCLCLGNSTNINRSIKHISAARNKIALLGDAQMRAFPALRFLNVSQNGLRSINDSTFASLSLLSVLDLSNNALQELPRTAFLASSFPQINGVAKQSQLATVSAPVLVVPRLSQVKLRVHGNPFHCNAELLWLKELFDRSTEQQGSEEAVNEPSCATPFPPAPFSKLTAANFRSFHPSARILNGAKNFTAAEGEPLNITCEVFGDPSPRVIWRISPDRETIFYPTNFSERRRVVQIMLTNVQRANEGLVTCMAVNRVGSHAAATHITVTAARLSWESVIDITLTAFVSCFVSVVIIALIVWACVTRRRRHTRLGRNFGAKSADDSGSGRSAVSTASSRQPSKSPSTSTGAESLLAFDEKSSQKHLHRIVAPGVPEEESSVHATLLAATDNVPSAISPSSCVVRTNGSLMQHRSNFATSSLCQRPPATVPLLVLDECSSIDTPQNRPQGGSLLMKTSYSESVDSSRPVGPPPAPKPHVTYKNGTKPGKPERPLPAQPQPQQPQPVMAKRVKLVASTLTPRVVKIN